MEQLFNFINNFVELDEETRQAVQYYFKEETYRKDEFIIEEGKVCTNVSLIQSGLVRRFHVNDGQEITKWIYYDDQMLTSMTSFFEQKPSFEYLQACENTTLYSLSYTDEQKLLEYPLFLQFHARVLRKFLAELNEFHHQYKLMTAQEKYNYLLNDFPKIIQRAKLKHVASMMGVSPETLSRIRSGIN